MYNKKKIFFQMTCILNTFKMWFILWSKLYIQHHSSSLQCDTIFRNHSNMLICCSVFISCYWCSIINRPNCYYYHCQTQFLLLKFFVENWQKKKLSELFQTFDCYCNSLNVNWIFRHPGERNSWRNYQIRFQRNSIHNTFWEIKCFFTLVHKMKAG